MAASRKCLNSPDPFCYVCGIFTLSRNRFEITSFHKQVYHAYFGVGLGDQDKPWAPHVVCANCVKTMEKWVKGESNFAFGVPMIWREPKDHVSDCYFCLIKTAGLTAKSKKNIVYPNLVSAIRLVPLCDDIPIPRFNGYRVCTEPDITDPDYAPLVHPDHSYSHKEPQLFDQDKLNDLMHDLGLSKEISELLASRLKEKYLLESGTKVIFYCTREKELYFFTEFALDDEKFVYCNNVEGLLKHMGVETYNVDEWRLFIDSSKRSFKCVILHNGNKYASVPIGHSVNMKEKYEEIKLVRELIQYKAHN